MSELLKINVNEHTEKKNGLTYLSWAWAWAKVLELDPLAEWVPLYFGQETNQTPYLQLPDGSMMVGVSVHMKGHTRQCMLPVMNHRNQAIKNPDAFAVNTAMMRCLAKAIAMHGLGLYIYAGEDLPEGEEPAVKPTVIRPSEECFKALQPEVQNLLRKAAPKIDAAMPDMAVVQERIQWVLDNYPEEERNDVRAGLEWLLDSKTRSAIKAHEAAQ